ncbi:MAG TPA: hypothetical protein VK681_39050 [Reyranella sp.]|nr:hypothetical protein [Reyranella sp.]
MMKVETVGRLLFIVGILFFMLAYICFTGGTQNDNLTGLFAGAWVASWVCAFLKFSGRGF